MNNEVANHKKELALLLLSIDRVNCNNVVSRQNYRFIINEDYKSMSIGEVKMRAKI